MAGGIAVIDNDFPEHRKVVGLHDRAFRFHVTALCYCSRNLTDGHVDARAVKVIAAILETTAKRWPGELVKAGLWKHDTGGDGFWINDYLKHNPAAESLKKLRDKRREAGIKGAEKRWGVTGDAPDDGKSDGKSHGLEQMPSEQSRAGEDLDQISGRQFDDDEGLPFENQLLTARLMQAIGQHADQGTRQVVKSYAKRLPPAALTKVIESMEMNNPRDRAAYVVGALRDELGERSNVA